MSHRHRFVPHEFAPSVAWGIFAAMVFGNFMAILDIQIVASSLNEIQAGIGASRSEVAWVQTAYLIAEVIAIPLSSFLSRLLSTRIYYSICALGFVLASLMCGFAWNLGSLLFFRAIQGFLGGGMIPTTMAALYTLFPPNKRAAPMVAVGMVSTLGPSIGPTFGGWLTTIFSWHWLFFINVIPGLIIASMVFSGEDLDNPNPELMHHIDWAGLFGMATFLGCLEYVLDEGPRNDWLADNSILWAAIAAIIGALVFFYRSITAKEPIIDIRVFKDKNFAISSAIMFMVGMVLYGMVYVLPVFLGQVQGYNSMQIGHVMMVMGVTMLIASPITANILPHVDLRKAAFLGMCTAAFGVWLNAHLALNTTFGDLFWAQVFRGLGFMFCFISLSTIAMSSTPPHQIKSASAVFNLTRNIGGAIGLALINTLLDKFSAIHVTALGSTLNPTNAVFMDKLNTLTQQYSAIKGDNALAYATGVINRQVHLQALTSSFNDILIILAIMMVSIATLVFLLKRPVQAAKN